MFFGIDKFGSQKKKKQVQSKYRYSTEKIQSTGRIHSKYKYQVFGSWEIHVLLSLGQQCGY